MISSFFNSLTSLLAFKKALKFSWFSKLKLAYLVQKFSGVAVIKVDNTFSSGTALVINSCNIGWPTTSLTSTPNVFLLSLVFYIPWAEYINNSFTSGLALGNNLVTEL